MRGFDLRRDAVSRIEQIETFEATYDFSVLTGWRAEMSDRPGFPLCEVRGVLADGRDAGPCLAVVRRERDEQQTVGHIEQWLIYIGQYDRLAQMSYWDRSR